MDFMHDTLADGRTVRVFTVVDVFSRECVALVRRECLSQHWFIDLKDAQEVLDRWRLDYNTVRPHGSLQRSTPAHFGAGVPFTPGPERLRNLHP